MEGFRRFVGVVSNRVFSARGAVFDDFAQIPRVVVGPIDFNHRASQFTALIGEIGALFFLVRRLEEGNFKTLVRFAFEASLAVAARRRRLESFSRFLHGELQRRSLYRF